MTTKELIDEVISLPVEERAMIADSMLRSLNPPQSEIDRKWAQVAQRRLEELRSGKVQGIPGEQVFARVLTTRAGQTAMTHVAMTSPDSP